VFLGQSPSPSPKPPHGTGGRKILGMKSLC